LVAATRTITTTQTASLMNAGGLGVGKNNWFREGDRLIIVVERNKYAKKGMALLVLRDGEPVGRIDAATTDALVLAVRDGVLCLDVLCSTPTRPSAPLSMRCAHDRLWRERKSSITHPHPCLVWPCLLLSSRF
jgi:hypothetical protein